MGLRMLNCEWPDSRYTYTHSTFCELQFKPIDLTISWESGNPYLNPKPLLLLPVPEVCGAEKLNEERLAGNGDFTLVFGEHSFPVHRLFVQSFSPLTHSMLSSGMKETTAASLVFPEVTYCSKEALDALVRMMYLGKIDFSVLPPSAAVELLELSSFLLSNCLKEFALKHLYEVGAELASNDILNLSFLQTKHPSENLKQLCDWLLRIKPQFYEELLNQDIVSTEDLFRLFAVSVDFKNESLRERHGLKWVRLSTAEKTAFVERAFTGGDDLHILEATLEFCNAAIKIIDTKDADKLGFVKAYKMLNDRVFELRTK
jgi:hypothetical protein